MTLHLESKNGELSMSAEGVPYDLVSMATSAIANLVAGSCATCEDKKEADNLMEDVKAELDRALEKEWDKVKHPKERIVPKVNCPKKEFEYLLRQAVAARRGASALMEALEKLNFYTSPASAKHHLNVPGGLVIHSLNVARTALELCNKMPQFAKCDKNTVLLAALLHDVCKAGKYIQRPDGSYHYEDNRLMGHGEESVSMIKDYIYLTDKEALAIRWHMGAYTGERDWNALSKVYDRYPEALCLHMADMIATHIMEVEK